MSKKDFIALADAIRPVKETLSNEVTEALLSFMHGQNPLFMEDRWIDYLRGKCGPNGGTIKATQK